VGDDVTLYQDHNQMMLLQEAKKRMMEKWMHAPDPVNEASGKRDSNWNEQQGSVAWRQMRMMVLHPA